jgi:hypothetical protein
MDFVFSDLNGEVNTLGSLVCMKRKVFRFKMMRLFILPFKMFSLLPGDFKPAYLATRKLDELFLSDSHMADGVEVTWCPQISAIRSHV